MSQNPWGKPANVLSWAEDAENAEEEEMVPVPAPAVASKGPVDDESFPSLDVAKTQKPKKKKEKGKTVSLSEFNSKLTSDELESLPKGPRERDESEDSGIGGGFKGYGGFRGNQEGGRGGRRDEGRDRDRQGGFGGREKEDLGPSRADESSNWGADRKFTPSDNRGGRDHGGDDRRRDDGDRPGYERGRSDDVSNWGAAKKYVPSEPRRSTGGYDDSRRSSFGGAPSRADGTDTWGSSKRFTPTSSTERPGGSADWSRSRGGEDAGRWGRSEPRDSSSFSNERPSERPRLNLQKRTVPLEANGAPENGAVLPTKTEAEPLEPVVEGVKTESKPRANPFGAARPREVLLQERGQDWRKIDMQLEIRAVERPESEEEKRLKEEIEALKGRIEGKAKEELANGAGEEENADGAQEQEQKEKPVPSFKDKLAESLAKEEAAKGLTEDAKKQLGAELGELELKLQKLTLELDDRVRFSQKADDSRVGRSASRDFDGDSAPLRDHSANSNRSGDGARRESYGRPREDFGRRESYGGRFGARDSKFPERSSREGRAGGGW